MATLSNAEFIRRMKQGRGIYEPETADDYSNEAYVDSFMSGKMLTSTADSNIEAILNNIKATNQQYAYQNKQPTIDQVEKESQENLSWWDRTWDTIQEVTYNVNKGLFGFFEGVGDFVIGAAGTIGSWFGADDQWAKNAIDYEWSSRAAKGLLQANNIFEDAFTYAVTGGQDNAFAEDDYWNWDFSDEGMQKYEEDLYNSSWLGETPEWLHNGVNNVLYAVGNMLPGAALGQWLGSTQAISQAISTAAISTSATGSGMSEAIQENSDASMNQVMLFGIASGLTEAATEYAFAGLGKVAKAVGGKLGSTGTKVASKIANFLPNSVNGLFGKQVSSNVFGQLTRGAIEEGLEEVMSDAVHPLLQSIYNGKSVEQNYQEWDKSSLLESFLLGGITSMVMAGPSTISQRVRSGKAVYQAESVLTEVNDSYNELVELQNSGRATEITENGDIVYNQKAQQIIDNMANSIENFSKRVDNMSATEKEKLYKALFNESVDDGFNRVQRYLDETKANYDTLVAEGRDNRLIENTKTYIDELQTIVNNGREKWANDKLNDSIKAFTPRIASSTQTEYDYRKLNKHLKRLANHSLLANKEQIETDIKDIQRDLTYFKNNASEEDLVDFGKRISTFDTTFGDTFTNTQAKQVFNNFVNSIESENVRDRILRYRVNEVSNKIGITTRIIFEDGNFNGEPSRYDRSKNAIYINRAYANDKNYSNVIAHEFVGHVLYDNFDTATRNEVVKFIKETDWYKTNKDIFEKTYDLVDRENTNTYRSELFANYLEQVVYDHASVVDVFRSIDTRKLYSPINKLIKKINRSTADNLLLDNLGKTLRRFRKKIFDSQIEIARNGGVAYSKAKLMEEGTIENYLANNKATFESELGLSTNYEKSSKYYEVNEKDFAENDFKYYKQKYNADIDINIDGQSLANLFRRVASEENILDSEVNFSEARQSFIDEINKAENKFDTKKKLTIEEFNNLYSLYSYQKSNTYKEDLTRFLEKYRDFADKNVINSLYKLVNKVGDLVSDFDATMSAEYNFSIERNTFINNEEVELVDANTEYTNSVIDDIKSQMTAQEVAPIEQTLDEAQNLTEEAETQQIDLQKAINIHDAFGQIENSISKAFSTSLATQERTQLERNNLLVETYNNLTDTLNNFKIDNETIEDFLKNINEDMMLEDSTNRSKLEEFITLTNESFKLYDEITSALISTKEDISVLGLKGFPTISSVLNMQTGQLKGNFSSQEYSRIAKSIIHLQYALEQRIYKPTMAILEQIHELYKRELGGKTPDLDFYDANAMYDVPTESEVYDKNPILFLQETLGENFNTMQDQRKAFINSFASVNGKNGTKAARLLELLGKARKSAGRNYITSPLYNLTEGNIVEFTGSDKTGTYKTIKAKQITQEAYDLIFRNARGTSVRSNVDKAHEHTYFIFEDTYNGQKNLSGFSFYSMGRKNANMKNEIIIDSLFNYGNNRLAYRNLGLYIDSQVFTEKNTTPINSAVILLNFHKDFNLARDAEKTLENFYIYPQARIVSTDYEISVDENGNQVQKNTNTFKYEDQNYVFALLPRTRTKRTLSSAIVRKVGKSRVISDDIQNRVDTIYSLINEVKNESRKQVEANKQAINQEKTKNYNASYYRSHQREISLERAKKRGYKKGFIAGSEVADAKLKEAYEQGKETQRNWTNRIEEQRKINAQNTKLFEDFVNFSGKEFFNYNATIKEARERFRKEAEKSSLELMSDIRESQPELYKKGIDSEVSVKMREYIGNLKRGVLDYIKMLNGNGVDSPIFHGRETITYNSELFSDWAKYGQAIEENTGNSIGLMSFNNESLDISQNLLDSSYLGDYSQRNKVYFANTDNSNKIRYKTPDIASETPFIDLTRKTDATRPIATTSITEGINKDDSLKVKAQKLQQNIKYNDKLLDFQIKFTNKDAGYEKALQRAGVVKDRITAEAWSKALRSAPTAGEDFIKRGIIKYNSETGEYMLDEKGKYQRTHALDEVMALFDDVVSERKKAKEKRNKRTRLTNTENEVMKDINDYAISLLSIDTSKAYSNLIKSVLYSRMAENQFGQVDTKEIFKNTFTYIDNQIKKGENIHYDELLRNFHNELNTWYYKAIDKLPKTSKEYKTYKSTYETLYDVLDRVFDSVDYKDITGDSISRERLLASEEMLTELSKYYTPKNETILPLKDALIQHFRDDLRTDIFFNEYLDILQNYIPKYDSNTKIEDNDTKAKQDRKNFYQIKNDFEGLFEPPTIARNEANIKRLDEKYQSNKGFKEILSILRENSDALLEYKYRSGLISGVEYQKLKSLYPHYVPLLREKVGSGYLSGGKNVANPIRSRKGSNEVIQPIVETIYNQIRTAPYQVELSKQLNLAYANGVNTDLMRFVDEETPKVKLVDSIDQDLNDFFDADRNGDGIRFRVYEGESGDYKTVKAVMTDEVLTAFRSNNLKLDNMGLVSGSLRIFKNLVTSYNPFFIVRNLARDVVDALFTTKNNSFNFSAELLKSFKELSQQKSQMFDLYLSAGGFSSSEYSANNQTTADIYKNLRKSNKSKTRSYKILHGVEIANQVVEQAARFTEFKLSYNRYLNEGFSQSDSLQRALLDSAEITTDFSRGGTTAKWLNRNLIPFLNAQIQGFSKLTRFIMSPKTKKQWLNMLIALLILGIAPDLINNLINRNNEDYEALPDYTKETYFVIPTGDGNFIKIPRGRIVGTVSSVLTNAWDVLAGKDSPTDALADFWDTATTNLAPVDVSGGINFIGKPFFDASSNITWYGQTIDKQSDLNKRPSQRYDAETSEISKFLGKLFNYSPKRIDYILAQSTGVVGDILLPLTTQSSSPQDTLLNFIKDNTTISSINNSRYSGEFYDYRTEVLYEANDGDLVASKVYSYLSKCIDEINILEEELDKTNSEAERYAIALTIREAYKQAITNAEDFKKTLSLMPVDDLVSEDRFAMTQAYADTFGSEYALKYYNSQTYAKAQIANSLGLSYDDFYNLYFNVRGAGSKSEAKAYIRRYAFGDMMISAYMKLLGISLTSEEEKQANMYFLTRLNKEQKEVLGMA